MKFYVLEVKGFRGKRKVQIHKNKRQSREHQHLNNNNKNLDIVKEKRNKLTQKKHEFFRKFLHPESLINKEKKISCFRVR